MKIERNAIAALDEFIAASPDIAPQAAALAMNTVIPRSGMARYKKAIRGQIAFPPGYLDDVDRFGVTRSASPGRLESVISARHRATSLARFATGGGIGEEGLAVKVKPGRTVRMKRAFKVRLKAGANITDDGYNLGLAVRVPNGQFRNKKDTSNMVRLAKDVFLLYAPSINQVFRSVADTETPAVLADIGTEFYRQFGRLNK